jgi:hypothetical protein
MRHRRDRSPRHLRRRRSPPPFNHALFWQEEVEPPIEEVAMAGSSASDSRTAGAGAGRSPKALGSLRSRVF